MYRIRCSRRFGKSRSISHQGGRADYPPLMRLHDRAVYTRSKSKIIGIHDETPHAESLAGEASDCSSGRGATDRA